MSLDATDTSVDVTASYEFDNQIVGHSFDSESDNFRDGVTGIGQHSVPDSNNTFYNESQSNTTISEPNQM